MNAVALVLLSRKKENSQLQFTPTDLKLYVVSKIIFVKLL